MGLWHGHPYVRQERRDAEEAATERERARVRHLIDKRLERLVQAQNTDMRTKEQARLSDVPARSTIEAAERRMNLRDSNIDLLEKLRKAVIQGLEQ